MMTSELQKRRFTKLLAILSLTGLMLTGCHGHRTSFADENTPTTGKIKIGVDQSYKLLLDTELFTFESYYKDAHIKPLYKPELDILKDFMDDSVELIITSRKLNKNEQEFLKSKNLFPQTVTIAHDAVALIVNNENRDSLIRFNDVQNIFEGNVTSWKQIDPKANAGAMKVVFDNEKSGNVRYFAEKFKLSNKLPSYCYAVNTNEQVVNYVFHHRNALGILSVNWVSDKNDSVSNSFLKRVKVVAISSEFNSGGTDFYRPYQAYIANKSYPFIRDVYAISREPFAGLCTGFTSFLAGQIGQRIILRSRLVPATMPVRIIRLKRADNE